VNALARFWKRDTPAGFIVRFMVIGGLAFCLYAFPFELFGFKQDWLSSYLEAYARLAGAVLRLFEPQLVVIGNRIEGRFPLEIVRTCDAAEVCILFATAVLAFPAALRSKLIALGVGLPCLVAANITRICSLYFLGVYQPAWFKVGHEEVWPLVLVGFAAFVFQRSARFMTKPKDHVGPVANA
jgi:exosortase/archaeosortase family protein